MPMKGNQLKSFLKLFKGLFEFATEEQAILLGDKAKNYEFDAAVAVLKTHAANHDRLSIPQLLEGLRADSFRRSERRISADLRTMAEGLRYYASKVWGRADLVELSDTTIIMTHFSECWDGVNAAAEIPDEGKNYVRRLIFAYAEIGLRQAGMTNEEARGAALDVVGMAPTAKFRRAWRTDGSAPLFADVKAPEPAVA